MNRHDKNIAEENVERLLSRVYTPQSPEAPFAERVRAAMQATAAKEARTRGEPVRTAASESLWDRKQLSDRAVLASWAVVGAIILGIFVIGRAFSTSNTEPPVTLTNSGRAISIDWNRDLPDLGGQPFITAADRPAGAEPQRVQIGQEIVTQRGERRRVVLPDGSVLYIDAETKLRLDDERRVTLSEGRIFVNVSPREESSANDAATFIVQTPDRRISALGTRFAVDVNEREDRVLVTQGKVKVEGLSQQLHTGQQVTLGRGERADDVRVTAAPRASHALDWTKDLMAAAEARLVPESDFAGGALLVEHEGEKTRFTLRKYHVDVHIEDGFARTTIDQTYFNHLPQRLEGTFYFPLPPDASISRLAMYVAGKRMEGGMVERNYGREVFESIKYRMQDPALLEWIDGSTFKMRVFPLEGRQEKRIILSYTQRLDSLYGRTSYRFPAGHNLGVVDEWTLKVHVRGHADKPWTCRSHEVVAQRNAGNLTLVARQTNTRLDRDVVVDLYDSGYETQMAQSTNFSSTKHEGSQYLMLRHRPNLPTQQKRQRRDWVFLFESSGDRNPLLARAQIDVIRGLLENAEHDDTFSIVTASTQLTRITEKQTATAANITAAIAKLEKTHLVGALDLAGALRGVKQITDPLVANGNPHLVHVGSGVPIMGERDAAKLAALVPEGVRYVGIGVGKRWSRSLMKQAAARTGGYYTQINPDEEIAWRAFDLLATLNTPRLLDVQVKDSNGQTWLCDVDSLAQGETLAAVTRWPAERGKPALRVTVTGKLNGEAFSQEFAINMGTPQSDYLPRTWAKLEIDRMLALDAAAHRAAIVKLSKAMYVMSPYTSLLVLENEAMYKQYKVDRGRSDHWALYPAPDTIKVVHEPLYGRQRIPFVEPEETKPPKNPDPPAKKAPQGPTAEDILRTIVIRSPSPVLVPQGTIAHNSIAATAWDWLGGYGSGWRYDPRNTRVVGWQTSALRNLGEVDFDPLIDLILATVAPSSWDEVGGPGNINGFEGNLSLVISQTQRVHEQPGRFDDRLALDRLLRKVGDPHSAASQARMGIFDQHIEQLSKQKALPQQMLRELRFKRRGIIQAHVEGNSQPPIDSSLIPYYVNANAEVAFITNELSQIRSLFELERKKSQKPNGRALRQIQKQIEASEDRLAETRARVRIEIEAQVAQGAGNAADAIDAIDKQMLPLIESIREIDLQIAQESERLKGWQADAVELARLQAAVTRRISPGGVKETVLSEDGLWRRFLAADNDYDGMINGRYARGYTWNPDSAFQNLTSGNHQEWQLGVVFSMPFGERQQIHRYRYRGLGDSLLPGISTGALVNGNYQKWMMGASYSLSRADRRRYLAQRRVELLAFSLDGSWAFDHAAPTRWSIYDPALQESEPGVGVQATLSAFDAQTERALLRSQFVLNPSMTRDVSDWDELYEFGFVKPLLRDFGTQIRRSVRDDRNAQFDRAVVLNDLSHHLSVRQYALEEDSEKLKRLITAFNDYAERTGTSVDDTPASTTPSANGDLALSYLNALTIQSARRRGRIVSLNQVERSAIPFQDELPLIYPDAELWRELTLRRNKFAAIDLHGLPTWGFYRPNVNAHSNFNLIDAFILSRLGAIRAGRSRSVEDDGDAGDLLREFEQDAFQPDPDNGEILGRSVANRDLREQQILEEVEKGLNDARRLMSTDPAAVMSDLKLLHETVKREQSIRPVIRSQLLSLVESGLRRSSTELGSYERSQVEKAVRRTATLATELLRQQLEQALDGQIVYPGAEIWEEMVLRRAKYSTVRWGNVDDNIVRALEDETECEFIETPFDVVVETLGDLHVIKIQIDRKALEDAGFDREATVTRKFDEISLRSALRLLLREFGLIYVVRHDSLLITTSAAAAADRLSSSIDAIFRQQPVAKRNAWQRAPTVAPHRGWRFAASNATFRDLLSYAPGMNTSRADVLAVLEEEGRERLAPLGSVDRRAAALLDKAKSGGWFALTLPIGKDEKLVVRFDLSGRYVYERRTADGLRERVICDGRTLWHLYPEIGVGAKRPVSRFHRRWLNGLVPWLAPLAEDLARGADVRWVDERTIAIVPHGWERLRSTRGRAVQFVETRLVFGEDGRLVERRRVVVPTGQVLLRVTYAADGTIVWLNGKDKQLATAKLPVTKAAAPNLNPEADRLVVVPMPLRTVESLQKLYPDTVPSSPDPNDPFSVGNASAKPARDWDEDTAISLIAAHCVSGNFREAQKIVKQRFYSDDVDDDRLGFNTLLIALSRADNFYGSDKQQRVDFQADAGNADSDLKDYLVALVGGKLNATKESAPKSSGYEGNPFGKLRSSDNNTFVSTPDPFADPFSEDDCDDREAEEAATASAPERNDFVRQLAKFRNLTIDLKEAKRGKDAEQRRETVGSAIEFVNASHSTRFAWAVVSKLDRLVDDRDQHKALAVAYERFEHVGPLAGEAVHQRALHSLAGGDAHAARNHFDRWYAAHLAWGVVPRLSKEFYQAHQQDGALKEWRKLVDAVAKLLRAASHPASVVQLAEQCRAAGDGPLADRLVIYVLAGVSERDRLMTTLAAVRYYTAGKDDKRAAKLVDGLLEDERLARWPSLWRLAATLADRLKKPARALTFTERALELTYKAGDEKIELEALRRDYHALMDRYAATAKHLAKAKQHPPRRLVDRLVRAADRWRSLEVDVTAPCQRASQVLRLLGEHDLAWQYLTTPLAMRPNEAQPWNDMAVALKTEGDIDLAELAYTEAFNAEETNAQILWDHAEMLEAAGRKSEARELYVQIAESKWGRAFHAVQNRARAKVQ